MGNCPIDQLEKLGHLLGPDMRTALCGVRLSEPKEKPKLVPKEQREQYVYCYSCIEIYEVIEKMRKEKPNG